MHWDEDWINTAVDEICHKYSHCSLGCPLKQQNEHPVYYCNNSNYKDELLVTLERLGYIDTKVTDNTILESDIMSILE